jgi:hypothetical protein
MAVVVSSPWSGAVISPRNTLLDKVCALYGLDVGTDAEFAARALGWLDDSIKDLNHHIWRSTIVAESGITLISGQPWFLLSSQVYKESLAYLVHNSDGDQPPLDFTPWVHFKKTWPSSQQTQTGTPTTYSIFNLERDARVYLYPVPDDTVVTEYTLTLEYYQRLPKISLASKTGSPNIPEEFENVLLYGAYKRCALHFQDRPAVGIYAGLEREALGRLKTIEATRPDAQHRFRLIDEIRASRS